METAASTRMGPRIFLSYSFEDAEEAQALAAYLQARGHLVHLEDERSLMDQQLTQAIRTAIADSEVLIQLLTPSSARSAWVAREMEMAFEIRAEGQDLAILPILTAGVEKPASIKDLWYLRTEGAGLSDAEKEEAHRFALRSVFALPLDPDRPFWLSEPELSAFLDVVATSDRRVILDPEQKLMGWAQDTLDYAKSLGPKMAGFHAQEQRYFAKLPVQMAQAEAVLGVFARHTVRAVADYAAPSARRALEIEIIQAFCEVVLGQMALHAYNMAPKAPHELRTRLKDCLAGLDRRFANPHVVNRPYLDEGFLKPIFEERLLQGIGLSGDPTYYLMEIGDEVRRPVKLIVPDIIFGSMSQTYTSYGIGFDPRGELFAGVFLKIILWQIAVYAYVNCPEEALERSEVLEERFAWRLSDYTRMGLA